MSHTSLGTSKRLSRLLPIIGIVVGLCLAIISLSIFAPSGIFPQWTGFGAAPTNAHVAQARTMTTLRRLNATNKSIVIRFLYDVDLIGNDAGKLTVINLSDADLSNIKLNDAFLSGADFAKTNLSCADLNHAWLMGATFASSNLNGANFSEAKLWNASMYSADLTDAKLNNAQVNGAKWDASKVTEEQLKSANHVDRTPE